MWTEQIAVVAATGGIPFGEVARTAGALQKQVLRDFAPIWGCCAVVVPFASIDEVPTGFWPLVLVPRGNKNKGGAHLQGRGQPFAVVEAGRNWSIVASHECLEMLIDPYGRRLVVGKGRRRGSASVQYLVEVCDPCQAPRYGYEIDDVKVSDFYTPEYIDSSRYSNARYSFTGALKKSWQILPGGYLSWYEADKDQWFQETRFEQRATVRRIGHVELKSMSSRGLSLREMMREVAGPKRSRVFARP